MTIYIDAATEDDESGHSLTRFGKLTFVDLAGSEEILTTCSPEP